MLGLKLTALKYHCILVVCPVTEGAIKIGPSRYTDNIVQKTQNEDKKNNTTQKTREMSNTDPKGEPRCSRRVGMLLLSYSVKYVITYRYIKY